jgi:hypothetical protein
MGAARPDQGELRDTPVRLRARRNWGSMRGTPSLLGRTPAGLLNNLHLPKPRPLAAARQAIGLEPLLALPSRRPEAPRPTVAVAAEAPVDRVTLRCIGLTLFGDVFLQKVAISVSATSQVSMTLIVGFLALGFLVLSGRVVIDMARFVLYAVTVAMLIATQLLCGEPFSKTSLLLLIVTYGIYILRLQQQPGMLIASLRLFQTMTLIVAGAAVVQYMAQFRLPSNLVFPLETYLGPLLYQGYNNIAPITYGSDIFKSNGVFLSEPSLLSQYMALSFIIERLFFRRVPFQLAYLGGLVVSYSGTGLLLLAVSAPFLIYKTGGLRLILLLLPIGLVILLAGKMLELNVVANRAGEFSSTDSSGFARFISIFYMLSEHNFVDVRHLLFGMGAGSIEIFMKSVNLTYLAHDPTWGKLLFEYGVLGAVAFFPYILWVIFADSPSAILSFCLTFALMLLGAYLLTPYYSFLIAALVAWQRHEATPQPATPAPGKGAGEAAGGRRPAAASTTPRDSGLLWQARL